jgi:glycine cleavage system H protein
MNIGEYLFQEDLLYDREHNWVRLEGGSAVIGVTDFFQKMAKEIVFIEIPLVGRSIERGLPFSSIESGKWVGRLKAPLSGKISAVNTDLSDFPYLLNESPYEEGWVIKVDLADPAEAGELFGLKTPEQVAAFTAFIEAEDQRLADAKNK